MFLSYQTLEKYTSIEVSEDKRSVTIFHGGLQADQIFSEMDPEDKSAPNIEKLCEFHIEDVWDMIQGAILTIDVDPTKNPGLFRRKGEAAAGILYTNKLYNRMENGT